MGILPFFHPTSIIIVDDDPAFLESFVYFFHDSYCCNVFQRPEQALEYVLEREKERLKFQEFYSDPIRGGSTDSADRSGRTIRLESSKFSDMLQSTERFRELSVAIIDFDMPGMTGIELCRHIRHLPIRKILLTGKMGVDMAISAFNEGVIDCFVTKQAADVTSTIRQEIDRLQLDYFNRTTEILEPIKVLQEVSFLRDEKLKYVFEDIIRNRQIEEYYLCSHPIGILMVDKAGTPQLLLVSDQESMRAQREIAEVNGAPVELLTLMSSGQVLTSFATPSGYFEPDVGEHWRRYVWPAQTIKGQDKWRYAIVDDLTEMPQITGSLVSHFDFLQGKFCAGSNG